MGNNMEDAREKTQSFAVLLPLNLHDLLEATCTLEYYFSKEDITLENYVLKTRV